MGSILVCTCPGEKKNFGNIEIYKNDENKKTNKINIINENLTLGNNDIINNKISDNKLYYVSSNINNINNSSGVNSLNDNVENINQLKNNSSLSDSIVLFNKNKSISPLNNPLGGLVKLIPKEKNNL